MSRPRLIRPADDDVYWDVIGDGWNPGHTLTDEEWEYENRTLTCFRDGFMDYDRGIYWKYERRSHQPFIESKDFAKHMKEILTGSSDGHIYEVEKNE